MNERISEPEEPSEIEFVRGPKRVRDIGNIPVSKIQQAYEERGINIEPDADHPGEAIVTKTVLKIPRRPQR